MRRVLSLVLIWCLITNAQGQGTGNFSSETVIGAAFGLLPNDHSRPGYIVNQNPNLYHIAHPDPNSFHTWKCAVGMYICVAGFYWASMDWMLGIEFLCCEHGIASLYEGRAGPIHYGAWVGKQLPTYPGSMVRNGAFSQLRMNLNAYRYSSLYAGTATFGTGSSALASDSASSTCPTGYVVSGLYGWFGEGADDLRPYCTPMYVPAPAGYWAQDPDGGAAACPAGTYNELTGASLPSACKECEIGSVSNAGAASCTNCISGSTFSTAKGQASCQSCTTCNAQTQYKLSQCTTSADAICRTCTACLSTQYKKSGCDGNLNANCETCSTCSAGYYKDGGCVDNLNTNCVLCKTCASGTEYSSTQCTATTNAVCSNCHTCGSGKIKSGCSGASAGTCINCDVGKFSAAGALTCTSCTAGVNYNSIAGSNTCRTCTVCQEGAYQSTQCTTTQDTVCTPCAIGTYKESSGSASCTACPPGKYADSTGSYTCTDCLAGTYRSSNGGTSSNDCISCDAGKYAPTDASHICTDCVAGKYSNTLGAGAESACRSCNKGTYSATVGAGSSAACIKCPIGTASDVLGATLSSTCQSCDSNKYADTTGTAVCKACTPVGCDNTQFTKPCTATSNAACGSCDTDGSSPANADYSDRTNAACPWACNSGYFKNAAGTQCCVNCDNGLYNPQCAASKTACQACNN